MRSDHFSEIRLNTFFARVWKSAIAVPENPREASSPSRWIYACYRRGTYWGASCRLPDSGMLEETPPVREGFSKAPPPIP